ncbi:hypothetical protein Ddye_019830 [Dipteronia dyeriana]|uniref:NAB domain-containing protein n=1 Tax=Dipteronia dyeriana TaxID=168575 RepID=A0AAD9TZM1_9ROSI|nr:hypothetical protein Ddye_019830 [Dipteronia dyeriana]
MATSLIHSNKMMKRMDSKKSHSWWWDSHVSPKNSKWLADNLEEMDQSVKRMLKLIEEDADSFAKKAEMYYKKRPQLISHVEEFYRMYRSLAERYDHVTGELRKNAPMDLQSQGSSISDMGSELPSVCPSPEVRLSRRKSGPRAAGFEFFLGSNGSTSSDYYQKEGDESSSLTDSEPESDDSSVNNYSVSGGGGGGDNGMQRRIIELEIELRQVKEKLRFQQVESTDDSVKGGKNENCVDHLASIARYEQDLRLANEKIQLSREEITRLKMELQKYKSEVTNDSQAEPGSYVEKDVETRAAETDSEGRISELNQVETLAPDNKIQALEEELRITKEKLQVSEVEIASLKRDIETGKSEKIRTLQNQLELAQKDIAAWKAKVNSERREVSKLQERITRLKTSLTDRDHEVRDLKLAVSDAEEKIFPEKAQIKAEISGLFEEKTRLEEQLKEWEQHGRSLEEEIRRIKAEKTKMEERLKAEIEKLKTDITKRDNSIEDLNGSLDALKSARDGLNEELLKLKADLISRDDQIDQLEKHLHDLHMEHMELNAHADEARKLLRELRSRTKELEVEIEKQRVVILEGAEEKREAIRQLCFSLEHYRNGYLRLREAFVGNKRVPVLAS